MPRIGLGYDCHRFSAPGPLTLGGVKIDHEFALAGHSDADAVLHAITDAILGAAGAGDIGEHFPDTDEQWAGADSAIFVGRALELAAELNYRVGNCDVTIVAERPRLGPYKDKMLARIAELLKVNTCDVSVKAKTNEGLGPLGRGEGIAVFAVVMLLDAGAESH
ncbi:MAG: 2-C-methyl-D-erythritol 2,4-cyclodiphosphate synthase [Planctomycetes bacterium]|nr:2-C-methyl-D-erythritol 2,4-cyclodiphosphate synthase [Planctomycetota bacterium]